MNIINYPLRYYLPARGRDRRDMPSSEGHLKLNMQTIEQDGQYIAVCKTLGLVTYGSTEEQADERILKMTTAALDLAAQEGVLEDYLNAHGVEVHL